MTRCLKPYALVYLNYSYLFLSREARCIFLLTRLKECRFQAYTLKVPWIQYGPINSNANQRGPEIFS